MSLIPVARGDGVALSPTQWRYVRVADAFSRSARCAFPGSHARTTPAVCLSVRPSVTEHYRHDHFNYLFVIQQHVDST